MHRLSTGRVPCVLCLFLLATACGSSDPAGPGEKEAAPTVSRGALAQTPPLRFEANVGQTDEDVAFVARGLGYTALLSPGRILLRLPAAPAPFPDNGVRASTDAVLALELVGVDPAAEWLGLRRRSETLTDLRAGRKVTGIPTYEAVKVRDVYPGIDLVFRGEGGRLRYDFVIAPGADPSAIALRWHGADALALEGPGRVRIDVAGHGLVQLEPEVFQLRDGARERVQGARVRLDADAVRFAVDGFDPERPLIIDPVLVRSTWLGGSDEDAAFALAVDAEGAVYLAGETASADLPEAVGVQPGLGGDSDAFVTKIGPDGEILWTTYLGGSDRDAAFGIAVSPVDGSVAVVGETFSADFPLVNPAQPDFGADAPGESDAFVARLSADGDALVFSTYLGGTDEAYTGPQFDRAEAVAVDAAGKLYVGGNTGGLDFPTTAGAALEDFPGGDINAFVVKYAPDGAVVWSTYYGGQACEFNLGDDVDGNDVLNGMALAGGDEVVIAGRSEAIGLPAVNAIQDQHSDLESCLAGELDGLEGDFFVARLTADGSGFVFSTYLGSGRDFFDEAFDVAVGPADHAHVVGIGWFPGFPTTGWIPGVPEGDRQLYVVEIARSGKLVSSVPIGTELDPAAVAVRPLGQVLVTGSTEGDTLVTVDAFQPERAGGEDVFVLELDAKASALTFGSYYGGSGDETAHDLALGPLGAVHLTGRTTSKDLPAVDPLQPGLKGAADAFLVRLAPDFEAAFETPGGNDWWVEVYVTANEPVARVQARYDSGPWIELQKKPWGSWARSFYVPRGSQVQFRAFGQSGEAAVSGLYVWPTGEPVPEDEPALEAAFVNPRGNVWWVETDVVANVPLVTVEARVNAGAWRPLDPTAWGSWADSFYVVPGSVVEFRARTAGGQYAQSGGYLWPDATPVDATEFVAAFYGVRGNVWWVETDVTANRALAGVDARVDGGAWRALQPTAWGSWADSFFVEAGSTVEFRARAEDGATEVSGPYPWPP